MRLTEISYLKDFGFSLKEIKDFNEETIKDKISQIKLNIKKLTENIKKLSTIRKEKGGFFMKNMDGNFFVQHKEMVKNTNLEFIFIGNILQFIFYKLHNLICFLQME